MRAGVLNPLLALYLAAAAACAQEKTDMSETTPDAMVRVK